MGAQDVDDHDFSGDDVEDGGRPEIPEGVLRGIEDIAEGETASKEDLDFDLKY